MTQADFDNLEARVSRLESAAGYTASQKAGFAVRPAAAPVVPVPTKPAVPVVPAPAPAPAGEKPAA